MSLVFLAISALLILILLLVTTIPWSFHLSLMSISVFLTPVPAVHCPLLISCTCRQCVSQHFYTCFSPFAVDLLWKPFNPLFHSLNSLCIVNIHVSINVLYLTVKNHWSYLCHVFKLWIRMLTILIQGILPHLDTACLMDNSIIWCSLTEKLNN